MMLLPATVSAQVTDLHPQGPDGGEEGGSLEIGSLAAGLLRRKWVVLGVTAVVMGAVAFLASREPRTYVAQAMVRLSNARQQLTSGVTEERAASGGPKVDPFASEALILRGRDVAARVVDRLGLRLVEERSGWAPAFLDSVKVSLGDGESAALTVRTVPGGVEIRGPSGVQQVGIGSRVAIAGVEFRVARPVGPEPVTLRVVSRERAQIPVQRGLEPKPREGTDVIDVTFSAPDPELARRIANAAVDAYVEVSTETLKAGVRRRREFLQEQVREAERNVLAAQAALAGYRTRKQVYNSTQRVAAEQANMVLLDSRRAELSGNVDTYRNLLSMLDRRTAPDGPEVRALLAVPLADASPYTSAVIAQLGRSLATHDSLIATGLLETHPSVQRVDELMQGALGRLADASRSQLSALEARLVTVEQLRGRSEQSIERLAPTEAEEARFVEQAQAMRNFWEQLRSEFHRARIAEAVEVGKVEIVDYATRATVVPLRRPFKIALGGITGLLLGAGLALALDRRKSAIRRREELQQAVRLPVLAVIRRLPAIAERGARRLRRPLRDRLHATPSNRLEIGSTNGSGPHAGASRVSDMVVTARHGVLEAEAYRAVRTRLMFARGQRPLRSLVVTSATPQEGKTVSSANIAAAFSEQGLRVLLIDCDLRRPDVHEMFGIRQAPGLTDLLHQTVPPDQAIRPTDIPRLSVLTSGTTTPTPAELLGGGRMATLLAWLTEQYDFVIMDTPPVLACADASVLATRADGVLMVVRAGQTGAAVAREAVAQVVAVGGRLVGTVLNDPDGQAGDDQSTAYSYGYAYMS
jgi:capsular exopolysaccharide synthesis family protein